MCNSCLENTQKTVYNVCVNEKKKEVNKMKWFTNPQTLEELKKQYKRLAMKHHPDIGGNVTDMQEINSEYDKLFEILKYTHQAADGKTYTAEKETTETAEEFKEIINRIINLQNITIEIFGTWIWITGDTHTNTEMY